MSIHIACPACDYEFDMLTAFQDNADQRAVEQFVHVCLPIGDRLMRYFTLFTPDKHRLTIRKQIRLMRELLPDMDRRAIEHGGREWPAPLGAWAAAIDEMLARRDANGLALPLKHHGYLYAVLAGMAKQKAEEAPKPTRDTVQVRGQPMSIGEGLQAMYGGKDPALAKLDDDTLNAAPMPAAVRERLDKARRGGA